MNYEKIYEQLIEKRKIYKLCKNNEQIERHHILPRSLGGDNNKLNIVNLTPREHFVAHKLLLKIYDKKYGRESIQYKKMLKAVFIFIYFRKQNSKINNSRQYEKIRKEYSNIMRNEAKNRFGGCRLTEQHKKKIGIDTTNRRWMYNKETKEVHYVKIKDIQLFLDNGYVLGRIMNQSGDRNPIHNHKFTKKERKRMSDRAKKTIKENKMFGHGPDAYMTTVEKEEWKNKIRISSIGKNAGKKSESTKEKIRKSLTGRILVNNGQLQTYCFPDNIPEGYSIGGLKKK